MPACNDAARLAADVQRHCRRHGLTFIVQTSYAGKAIQYKGESTGRTVKSPRVTGPWSYLVAMHEIGHCVRWQDTNMQLEKLNNEADAWDWAVSNSIIPISEANREKIWRALNSYIVTARAGKYGLAQATLPTNGSKFYNFLLKMRWTNRLNQTMAQPTTPTRKQFVEARKVRDRQTIRQIRVGDEVIIKNMRPKYINDEVARVVQINQTRVGIQFEYPIGRFIANCTYTLPASCVERI